MKYTDYISLKVSNFRTKFSSMISEQLAKLQLSNPKKTVEELQQSLANECITHTKIFQDKVIRDCLSSNMAIEYMKNLQVAQIARRPAELKGPVPTMDECVSLVFSFLVFPFFDSSVVLILCRYLRRQLPKECFAEDEDMEAERAKMEAMHGGGEIDQEERTLIAPACFCIFNSCINTIKSSGWNSHIGLFHLNEFHV